MDYRLGILLVILLFSGMAVSVPVYEGKIDGNWSEWINVSLCYAKSCDKGCDKQAVCDTGHVEQIRLCNNPSPRNGGRWCYGPALRTISCSSYDKPGWSEWGPAFCFKGCRSSEDDIVDGSKKRYCTNPPPIHDKDACCGTDTESEVDDPDICNHLPLCSDTTVDTTTTTTSTLSTTAINSTENVYEYGCDNSTGTIEDGNAYDYGNPC